MINYNLDQAKKRVIALIKSSSYDYCSDMMSEIKNAANNDSIDDVEMFVEMIRAAEKISNEQIKAVEEAYCLSEILKATADSDEPGNVLFECEDQVLSAILETKIKQDWGC